MAGLLSLITNWVKTKSDHYTYVAIPADGAEPLAATKSYFRVWLAEMYLAESSKWFTKWYPSVTSTVSLKYGGNQVVLNAITQAPENALSKGVKLNYRLIDLTPFNGGVVEIAAALLAVPGSNLLSAAVDTLSDFSSLVVAPLGPAIPVAQKVQAGVEKFLNSANAGVHLALHQSFTSTGGVNANPLIPGYLAVVLAPNRVIHKERLSIEDDQLQYTAPGGGKAHPLEGYDYMLLRIEARDERDDWRLKDISDPLQKAIEATLKGATEEAQAFRTTAITSAWQSPDLAAGDRRRVVQAVKAELEAVAQEGLHAAGGAPRSLLDIVQTRAMSAQRANNLPAITLAEALS
jgi:hypothetical protein